ncbi:hypothetical protein B4Q13_23670, partial [Lacticaseibacillus rhamnosus]
DAGGAGDSVETGGALEGVVETGAQGGVAGGERYLRDAQGAITLARLIAGLGRGISPQQEEPEAEEGEGDAAHLGCTCRFRAGPGGRRELPGRLDVREARDQRAEGAGLDPHLHRRLGASPTAGPPRDC